MIRYWNHQVHLWLKFYIMERLTPEGKRPGTFENMFTYMVSALWHGFYPCYYVMFFFNGLLGEVCKDLYRARTLFSFIPGIVQTILANQLSFILLNYNGVIFCALTWENTLQFMKSTNFDAPILLFTFLVLSRSLGLVRYARKLEAKKVS